MLAFAGKNFLKVCTTRTAVEFGTRHMHTTYTTIQPSQAQPQSTLNHENGLKKSYQEILNRNAVHHIVFSDVPKTPFEIGLEERVQSLFNENCEPDVRDYIIRSIVRDTQVGDQHEKQSATDLLIRLSNDLNLNLPAINREYVTRAVAELDVSADDCLLARQLAYETRKFIPGDYTM